MNRPIRQAQGEKGFAPLIIIIIATLVIGGGVGGFLVLREKKVPASEKTVRQIEDVTSLIEPTPSPAQSIQPPISLFPSALGNLCSGEKECKAFCQNSRGQCEAYCKENKNELCPIIFPAVEPIVEKQPKTNPTPTPPSPSPALTAPTRQDRCEGTKTKFDYAPVNLDETLVIHPLGIMVGDHVSPIDHHFFQNFENKEFDIEVYSPGPGVITEIGHMPGAKAGEDYRIVIQHTCTVSGVYIYVSRLPEKLKKPLEGHSEGAYAEIPVQAGELIGYYKNNLDYNLVDEEVILTGFIVPEHYWREPWKIHVPNTYNYFNEPVKSKLIAKSIRTAEPISGKIDYDIDGKLVGNWFVEGTVYVGPPEEKEWVGHLSIVYDPYDPERIAFSIGGYGGEDSKQFGVKGNAPDPKEVGVESGLVKYELVRYEYITPSGGYWDRISLVKNLKTQNYDFAEGVALVQMIEDRKIKFEAFPGKTGAGVSGFTERAKIYER